MHTFRGRACLLLGLAFLILTGVFFGPGSSGALAQESFALTHGDLYWNSPKSDKESDDTWRIFHNARLNITRTTVQGWGYADYDYYHRSGTHFVGSGQWSATGAFDPATGRLSGRFFYVSSYTTEVDGTPVSRVRYETDFDFTGLVAGPGNKVRLAASNPMGTLKIEQRQPKSGKWITTDDYPRRPDTLGYAGVEFTQEGGPPRQTRAARPLPPSSTRAALPYSSVRSRGDAMPIARLPKATFSPRAASSTSEARETHSWEAER